MAETKITLRSLAHEVGVAPSTVLRALSGHPNVTLDLRRRIIAIAQKRHYHLPERYKSLIAVIIPGYSFSGYSGLIVSEIMRELADNELHGEIISENDLEVIHDKLYAGAISIVWNSGLEKQWPTQYNTPLVVLNAVANLHEGIYRVTSDDHQGITMGLEELYRKGRCKLAFVTTRMDYSDNAKIRVKTFMDFCRKKKISDNSFYVEITPDCYFENVADIIISRNANGVFAACETYGHALLFNLIRRGKNIPKDISMIGLEYPQISNLTLPPLTTLAQDFAKLAHQTVHLLQLRMNEQPSPTELLIPYRFIERESL